MFFDRPARETTREFHHVALSVAAVHAEGVEFHEFARIIFVGMTLLVDVVIEIDQHRGRMCRRPHEIAEVAERVFANHFAVVNRLEIKQRFFLDEDVEMIAPKFDHHFVELSLAVNLTKQRCLT